MIHHRNETAMRKPSCILSSPPHLCLSLSTTHFILSRTYMVPVWVLPSSTSVPSFASLSISPSLSLSVSLRRRPRMPLQAFTFVPRLINHGLPLFLKAVPRGTRGPIGFSWRPDAQWESHSSEPHTIPRDLDITDDRIVNGVTHKTSELSSLSL